MLNRFDRAESSPECALASCISPSTPDCKEAGHDCTFRHSFVRAQSTAPTPHYNCYERMHNMGAFSGMSSCWHENDASNPPSSWAPSTRLPRLKIGSALPPSSLGFPYSATFPESRFKSPVDAEYPFDQSLDNPSSSPEGNLSELGLSDSEAPELIEDDGESPPYNSQLLSPVSPELSPEWSPRRIAGASDAEGDGEPSSKAMLLSGGHSRSPYAYGTYEARRDVPIYDYDPHDQVLKQPGYDDQYAYYQPHLVVKRQLRGRYREKESN